MLRTLIGSLALVVSVAFSAPAAFAEESIAADEPVFSQPGKNYKLIVHVNTIPMKMQIDPKVRMSQLSVNDCQKLTAIIPTKDILEPVSYQKTDGSNVLAPSYMTAFMIGYTPVNLRIICLPELEDSVLGYDALRALKVFHKNKH
jgi:hypothetical protein